MMQKQTISTSPAPEVIIEQVDGSLSVQGWDEPHVVVRYHPDDLVLEEREDVIRLSCHGECDLRVPEGASVKVENVQGSARFKSLEDELAIEEVHGSLSLRNVAAVQIGSVHGELTARYLTGDLQVGRVHGNASVRQVQGACELEQVGGNADLRNIETDIQVEASGNLRLRLAELMGTHYQLKAAGNINVRIPEGVSLHLSLTSLGRNIKVKLPEGPQAIPEQEYELTLDDGEIKMDVQAGGNLYLICEGGWDETELDDLDLDSLDFSSELSQKIAQQIEAQIQSQVETMTREINAQVAQISEQVARAGLSPEETERFMEQARQASQRETERAQEKILKSKEKLERKLEAARRKQEIKAQAAQRRARVHSKRSWGYEPPAPPAPSDPVSEEEHLMILNMLEQKKISLEEAEQLLAALEGKES